MRIVYISIFQRCVPFFSSPPSDSWSELCLTVARYAAAVPASHSSQPLLMSRLENLLEKVRLKGHRARSGGLRPNATSWSHDDDDNLYPAANAIPWDDVLIICIDHKLRDWQMPGPPVCEGGDRFSFPFSGFKYNFFFFFFDVKTSKMFLFLFKDAVTEDGEILVYFLADALKGFQPPDEWTEAITQTHKEKEQEAERSEATLTILNLGSR